ncbi:Uncharacterised protein [Pluralibacter gergoviae]|nr:Uncharacterised protein [Pluralibacter gergoviae]
MAIPSTKPLNTSQKAEEAKPPKTTSGGAIFAAIAAVKNSSAVINSGSREVAHSRIVMPTISEGRNRGWVNQSDIPVSCRFFPQVYDALRDR